MRRTLPQQPGPRQRIFRVRDGFTLIEVMVALGLFALIATAGFTLLNSVLSTQDGTETRLRRLAEIQRALFVVTSDLDQLNGSIQGGESEIAFQKTDLNGRSGVVRYGLADGVFQRTVAGPQGERTQALVSGVTAARWSYFHPGFGWAPVPAIDLAVVAPGLPTGALPPDVVSAVALDLVLAGPGGTPTSVRRVVSIPETGA